MRTLRLVLLALTAMIPRSGALAVAPDAHAVVTLVRVPHGGIQPQVAVDSRGMLHLLYFAGEPRGGNLFYVRSADYGRTFSAPIRVNSQDGSAIAIGTIRGGQLTVGRDGRVHVGWNGSDTASPRGLINPADNQPAAPFLYTRSNPEGTVFEPQRNLTRRSYGLDGGGSIAVGADGHVYAAWHAQPAGGVAGEDHRTVWLTRSTDEGATFADEHEAWREPTGACGCCGLTLFAGPGNRLYILYRSATSLIHRDMYLLESADNGLSFRGSRVQPWDIAACPMTSMSLASSSSRVIGAWESAGQVYLGAVDSTGTRVPSPVAAPGVGANRKHPRIAANPNGEMLLLWTEGTAWARGGSLAWQLLDAAGHPAAATGTAPGVPVWSFGAAAARPDGGFVVFY